MNTTTEFCIFELLAYVSNFIMNKKFWISWPNFFKEVISCQKQEKWTSSLNWQYWFFGPNFCKKSIFSLAKIKWTTPLESAYNSIQDTISVTFPREDKIYFSVTKYIWHLKLWQYYTWQISLPKSYRFSSHWSCVVWDNDHYRPKKLKNRHFWVT